MTFSFLAYTDLVNQAISTGTANCSQLINFAPGSVIRTIFEAVCGIMDYFTIQLKKILLVTRAATSSGSDLDTFIADYNMSPRLQAIAASGLVTLTRKSVTSSSIFIPASTASGPQATLISADGTLTFDVIPDVTNINYNSTANGYYIPANQASVNVTVSCETAGVIGNVGASTITLIGSGMPGVDLASNASSFTNGLDQESDAAVRIRFANYINSLARSTKAAIGYAITSVQQGLTYQIAENVNISNQPLNGYFTVVVDNGTGSPPASLLSAIQASINNYRACTVNFDVYAPSIVTANVSMTCTVASGYTASTVKTAVQSAITSYINSLTLGTSLPYMRLAQVAFDTSPGVQDITLVTLNSGTSDISASFNQVIKAGTVTVN